LYELRHPSVGGQEFHYSLVMSVGEILILSIPQF